MPGFRELPPVLTPENLLAHLQSVIHTAAPGEEDLYDHLSGVLGRVDRSPLKFPMSLTHPLAQALDVLEKDEEDTWTALQLLSAARL